MEFFFLAPFIFRASNSNDTASHVASGLISFFQVFFTFCSDESFDTVILPTFSGGVMEYIEIVQQQKTPSFKGQQDDERLKLEPSSVFDSWGLKAEAELNYPVLADI